MTPATLALKKLTPGPNTLNTIVVYAGIGAALFFAGRAIKKAIKNKRADNTNAQITDNRAIQSAQILRSAMNPSGVSWLRNIDGTNADVIMNEAKIIADFADVQKQYKKMFNDDLTEDLRQELSVEKYNQFLEQIKKNVVIKGKDGKTTVDMQATGQTQAAADNAALFFVSKKKTGLYKSGIAGIMQHVEDVEPLSYLPSGNGRINIKNNTSYKAYWDIFRNTIRTIQETKQGMKDVYIIKEDWDIVEKNIIMKGISEKKYKRIFIDDKKY
ncbi:MAG: hypothetical protein SNJ71_00315 [Bacteroidales bacterium]